MSPVARAISIGGRAFPLGGPPHVLGVINLSPDSPNQDSVVVPERLLERAAALAAAGAEIIDVGAQSSHFRSALRPLAEERRLIADAVRRLKDGGYLVSVDSFRPAVVAAALAAGCDLVNNSQGLQSGEMLRTLRGTRVPVVIPFIGGVSPRRMRPFDLEHPLEVIIAGLKAAQQRARDARIENVILDPGTGYAYPGVSAEEKERYQERVYRSLGEIRRLGCPLLVAVPRKASRERTLALTRLIVENRADFLRAHDPALAGEAIATARR